jgi:hypothetical protein
MFLRFIKNSKLLNSFNLTLISVLLFWKNALFLCFLALQAARVQQVELL